MINIYAATATDYSTNGLMVLDPWCTSAVIAEKLNGEYTLTMELEINSRTVDIAPEMVVKCPAPVRFTPQVDIYTPAATEVYRVTTSGLRLNLRTKPSMTTGRVLSAYAPGTEVIVTDKSDGTWYAVAAPDGRSGYMYASNLTYVRTDNSAPVNGGVVESHKTKEQLFRVRSVSSTLDCVTVETQHISYDLRRNYIKTAAVKDKTGADALPIMLAATINPHEFTGYSDITAKIPEDITRKNPISALLSDGGLVAEAGGQILRDNFDIYWVEHIGSDRGVSIAYRKNMAGMDVTIDTNDLVTRIIPIGYDKDNKPIYGDPVDSEHINEYAQPYILEYEYKDVKIGNEGYKDEAAVKTEIARLAALEYDNDIDLPTVSATVDFVDLQHTSVGKDFPAFTGVFLGDTVRIRHEDYRFDIATHINAYEWDVLRDEYISIELGSRQASLSDVKLSPSQIGNSTLSGRKLAVGTISGTELGEGSVGGSQIVDGSVTGQHIAPNTITADNIVAGAITTDKLAAKSITADQIAAGAVTTDKLAAKSVTADKIDAGAITTDKLAANAITAGKIDAGAITSDKIKAGAVTADKIAAKSITAAQIAAGTITADSGILGVAVIGTAQIADQSITSAKIVELNADLINAGTLSVERLLIVGEDGIIHRINATSAGLTATQLTQDQYKNYLNGTVIVAKSVTAAQIAAKTITANEIAAGTITSGEVNTAELFASKAFVDALVATDIRSNSYLNLLVGDYVASVYVGGTQLLTDTRELTTGTGTDKWRLAGAGASTYTQAGTDFKRIKLVSSGATENTWTGASSPVLKLPSGWQGKQITLSAWIYSADWAAVDQGMSWVMCLNNDGSTSRMTYRSKYNMVKPGKVELGADAVSDTKLANSRWTRVSTTFTLTADYFTGGTQAEADFSGNTHAYVQFFLARNGDVRLYAPKLEMGNKATDWSPSPDDPVDKLKTSYIEIMEDHIDIGTGGSLNINAGDFNVQTGDFTMSLTEGDNAEVVMDIGDDGVTDFKGIRAGNVREAVYSQVDMSGAGGLKGLVNKLARTDARRVTYTATADESGEVMLDKFCGSLTIKGAGFKLPRITLGRAFTGTLNVENAILTQSGTAYAFHAGNGTAVLYNCWFAPGTTHGVLAEYTASVRWYNAQAVADLTPMTLTYLFYPRYCGEITYTGKIPGGEINAVSGFVQESSGTTTTVVSGTSTAPTPTTATVSLTATLGYYGTLSGWVSGSCYQGYTTGRGELYGCLKFDVSSLSGKTVQSAKLTLHRVSGVGRNRDAAVYVYGTTTEWGSSAKPALGTKWGESAALMAWDEDGTLTIDKTGVQRLVNGSGKQLLLYTGETSGYDGKVYSQHYAQFDSAVLEVTYST